MIDISQGEIQVTSIQPNDLFQREYQVFNPTRLLVLLHCWVGKEWAGRFFPPPPPHPPPPPYCLDLSIYCLVFRFMLLFDCIRTILNDLFQREIKFLNQQVNSYFYIVGWGKTGPAHSFPPPKCWDFFYLSSRLLDYVILLLYLNSLDLIILPSRESSFQANKFICNCRVGKDWAGPFFPPSLIFRSSIDRFVFRFMLLFHSILTFMKDLYQSENQVFNPTRLLVLLHCWEGKELAGPFFPPPPSIMLGSFNLLFSLSVYVTL